MSGQGAEDAEEAAELGFGAGNFASDRQHVERPKGSHYRGGDQPQPDRWRCLIAGCNPMLDGATAQAHRAETGHRVAAWPVRSAEGKRRARARNKSGYYDVYNVDEKAFSARLGATQ